MRPVLRFVSTVLIAAGLMLMADAIVTVVWQEPVSAAIATRTQHQLDAQLDDLREDEPSAAELQELRALPSPARRLDYAARRLKRKLSEGDPVGKIELKPLDKSYVMVYGTSTADLRKGPGVYPDTPLPGEGGTTGIAGHRTTYGAPFRHIDQLDPGDRIVLKMPYGEFTYAVQGTRIVQPDDLSVIRKVGYERIVLTACHPLYSAAQRIVAFARLVKAVPTQRIADVGSSSVGR